MEGYFPIYEYCEITGCKKDTAYHRVYRGTIESFKGKDGRWFLYFSDNREIPAEGFISIEDYAKKVRVAKATVQDRIRRGYFDKTDTVVSVVIDSSGHPLRKRFIRETCEWKDYRLNSNKSRAAIIMNLFRPKGTYTVKEYATILDKPEYYVRYRVRTGNIKSEIVNGHFYVYPEKE